MKIKDCPFCGTKASIDKEPWLNDSYVYSVHCLEGHNLNEWNTEELAIKEWNQRHLFL